MMKNELSSKNMVESWSGIENYLSQNLRPVSPGSVFIDNLRTRLENPDSVTLETAEKTRQYLFTLSGFIAGLGLMVLTIYLFVQTVIQVRRRRSHSP
jgi:hypothetical protein